MFKLLLDNVFIIMKKDFFIYRLVLLLMGLISIQAMAVNPYLPLWEYIPDGEPYIFEDPDNPGKMRVYVYGSHDSMITDYCGRELVLWSASVDSLSHWRYDGIIFESKKDANGKWLHDNRQGDVLFAPDVVETKDADGKKTYYLYPNNQGGGRQGMVAKSDRPDGLFVVCNWSKTSPQETEGVLRFDPAVFVDDDGRVYGYWGFEKSWGAELDPQTMATVKKGGKVVENMVSSKDHEGEFRFFEASSIRKIKDKYVFIYSRWTNDGEFGLPNSNYTLAYAYSNHPLGPFTYGGTIIDGRGRCKDKAGNIIYTANPSGNTHGSILEINGQWYVFYHRQTGTNEFSRQAMVAPIEVKVTEGLNGKVEISEGEYNSEGFETKGLNPFKEYSAGIACYYTGPKPAVHAWPNTTFYGSYIKPVYRENQKYKDPYDLRVNTNLVVNNTDGSIIGYKYFNFDHTYGLKRLELLIDLLPQGVDGQIDIWAGSPWAERGGIKAGSIRLSKSMSQRRRTVKANVSALTRLRGKQALYFVISADIPGRSICELHQFTFKAKKR